MLSDERLAEIKARAEAATEGPWTIGETRFNADCIYSGEEYGDKGDNMHLRVCEVSLYDSMNNGNPADQKQDAHLSFIAHSRVDIPDLIDEVERLKGELKNAMTLWESMGRAM